MYTYVYAHIYQYLSDPAPSWYESGSRHIYMYTHNICTQVNLYYMYTSTYPLPHSVEVKLKGGCVVVSR